MHTGEYIADTILTTIADVGHILHALGVLRMG
ncbi:hypothetical protein F444_13667 [Phytophthora nicotianae P1976]|uniref:Uncharacterized protein n=1 Tax=Phytophthora nicotianae P1976 TaxID=1317066 RepID=A0A080ZT45_PHYNI|nr:hypothetical protein F444_13667 [Phytophthora nicotianae P1976]